LIKKSILGCLVNRVRRSPSEEGLISTAQQHY